MELYIIVDTLGCLASLIQHEYFEIYLCCLYQEFKLLICIPLYKRYTRHLAIYLLLVTGWCFQLEATASEAVKVGVQVWCGHRTYLSWINTSEWYILIWRDSQDIWLTKK